MIFHKLLSQEEIEEEVGKAVVHHCIGLVVKIIVVLSLYYVYTDIISP
jgi:hypothetical protein